MRIGIEHCIDLSLNAYCLLGFPKASDTMEVDQLTKKINIIIEEEIFREIMSCEMFKSW